MPNDLLGCWRRWSTTAKYARTTDEAAAAAVSESETGATLEGAVEELDAVGVVDAGSPALSAQPVPATSRSATVAEIARIRTFVMPECPPPSEANGLGRTRTTLRDGLEAPARFH
ncbi:hypothetical protein GCM10027600_25550 [Nocardioides ginsengisegetis]